MSKLVYCIRHGLSQHNVNYMKYGSQTFYDPKFTDTSLLDEGFQQAETLRKTWSKLSDIEVVIVSPLLRTLQTATELFKDVQVPIVALESVREYPRGLHTCNKRSSKEYLMKQFPHVDFTDLTTNEDMLWLSEREETLQELTIRIELFKEYIISRPETTIAFVNHNSFIGQMKDQSINYLDNGQEELMHCYPYVYKL